MKAEEQLIWWLRNGGVDRLRHTLTTGPAEPVCSNELLVHVQDAPWVHRPGVFDVGLAGDGFERTVVIGLPSALFLVSLDEPYERTEVYGDLQADNLADGITAITHEVCRIPMTDRLRARIRRPRVLLVGLSPLEGFAHTPMIALGVSSLAAVLRQRYLAEVLVLDQRLTDRREVVDRAVAFQPDLVGLSIDFGERGSFYDLLSILLSRLEKRPTLFAGNYLAHLFADEILERHPELVICHSEGEQFVLDLVAHVQGRRDLSEVSAAAYRDQRTGCIRRNPVREYPINSLPFPALDMLPTVAQRAGAIMLELSRGCSWNACSFCPRDHKTRRWRALPPARAARWLKHAADLLADRPGMRGRIYLCDEEFIGTGPLATDRLEQLAGSLRSVGFRQPFEINTRVDSVYDETADDTWLVGRWQALQRCRDVGLRRILLGVESGCDSVLHRFQKGHSVEESICAIRVLSALGIDIRVTFITYDPLMSPEEFVENFRFLARRDVILNPIGHGETECRELVRGVRDPNYVRLHATGMPLYIKVCYLHNSMKMLPESRYARSLTPPNSAPDAYRPISGDHQPSVSSEYVNPLLGTFALAGERWMAYVNRLTYRLSQSLPQLPRDRQKSVVALVDRLHEASFELLQAFACVLSPDVTNPPALDESSFDEAARHLRERQVDDEEGVARILTLTADLLAAVESEYEQLRTAEFSSDTPCYRPAPSSADILSWCQPRPFA